MNKFVKFFIQGLFYTVPAGITIYLIYKSLHFLDKLLPFKIPGLGFVIMIVLITFIGYLGSVVLASSIGGLVRKMEKIVFRIPLVRMVYTALKDLVSALTGSSKTFEHAVLVTLDKENQIEKLGFVTKDDLHFLGIEGEKVAVYFPYSYGIMGDLRIVPKSSVKPIEGKSSEIMKFIVSGGVAQLDDKKD